MKSNPLIKKIVFFLLAFSFYVVSGIAQKKVSFELFGGVPYNFPSPLNIYQSGFKNIILDADFFSEPFISPYYWIWRFSLKTEDELWEFEAIHHKLYLDNKPREVESFGISHGFNILTINRGWILNDFIFRTGIGVVLTHPENKIREKILSEDEGLFSCGYYFSGPVFSGTIGKRLNLIPDLFFSLEAKITLAYVNIPVNDGNADVLNCAVHFAFGFGYYFITI